MLQSLSEFSLISWCLLFPVNFLISSVRLLVMLIKQPDFSVICISKLAREAFYEWNIKHPDLA